MRSIDCQHPSPFALHHLPPPPPPPLPPSLPPIRATPSPCPLSAHSPFLSLFLSLLFVVLYCAAICSPLLLPHGDVSLFSFSPVRARALLLHYFSHLCFCSLHSTRRRAAVSRLLSRLWDNYLSIWRERVFPRNTARRTRPNRKTILAICNCYRV